MKSPGRINHKLIILFNISIALICITSYESNAQSMGISSSAITPDASSILEMRTTTKGLLIPRMTTTERDNISSPATGLMIYNTTTGKFNFYNGSTWHDLFSGTSGINSITGTSNRITIGGTAADPTIDISSGYAGQSSITTLGTIGTGTWNGSTIGIAYGGTGQTTQQAAINALTGTQTSGTYLRSNGTNASLTAIQVADIPTLNQNTTGSAATLTTSRNIYGNPFNGSADVTGIIASIYGGTGNGFSKFSGATTSEKTYTLPDASTTILTKNYTGSFATGILKNTTSTGDLSIAVAGDFPTLNQNTTGSAATLTTARSIYGNSFNGSADLTQIIASTYGGTGNGFSKFSGATTSEKTYTLPDASTTILTKNYTGSFATGILKNTTSTGDLSIAVAGDFPTLNQNTTGSAATLITTRDLYGFSFNGSAGTVSGTDIIAPGYGGTNNGFFAVTGPATSTKTFTFPNASATILTTNAAVTVAQGGTGATTLTGLLKGNGTSPFTVAAAGTDYSAGTSALATGILKSTTTTGALSIAVAGDFPTLNQNTTGSAATLTTARNIYGNSFNGSADLSQIIASTYGGTGNGFTKFAGPATSEKTFTLPNVSETIATLGQAQTFTGVNTFNAGKLVYGAGTTALSPENFTTASAALLTSPGAGDGEVDANGIRYYTHATSERGVMDAEQFITLTSTNTLTSQTALQNIFDAPTNGALTVAGSKTYFFECEFDLSSMSSSSGTFSFGFGGTATLTSVKYTAISSKTAIGTPSTAQITTETVATAQALVSANTTTTGRTRISGIVRINAGGTLIPSVGLSIAAAAVVGVNSWFRITPVGTNTVTSVGNWN